jgi:hypothetical protein
MFLNIGQYLWFSLSLVLCVISGIQTMINAGKANNFYQSCKKAVRLVAALA